MPKFSSRPEERAIQLSVLHPQIDRDTKRKASLRISKEALRSLRGNTKRGTLARGPAKYRHLWNFLRFTRRSLCSTANWL